jgi:hypothetical protein
MSWRDELEQTLGDIKHLETQTAVSQPPQQASWWSVRDAMTISASVLVFGLLIVAVATAKVGKGQSSDSMLRLFGTLTIIIAAVFLVVAGYSDKQIAPVMGLLGTIAGYLLGKPTENTATTTDRPKPA